MEKVIVVVTIDGASVSEVLSEIFALRTHVPKDSVVDLKYVLGFIPEQDVLILGTHNILLSDENDIHTILSTIPSGSYRTLDDGTRVVVNHIEV